MPLKSKPKLYPVRKFQHQLSPISVLIFLAFNIAVFTGCEKAEVLPSLKIRVVNLTGQNIENLLLHSLTGGSYFGTVDAGGNTNYRSVGAAYATPACEFVVDNIPYKLMIRCANPSPDKITRGNYSLVIEQKSGNEFDVELRKD